MSNTNCTRRLVYGSRWLVSHMGTGMGVASAKTHDRVRALGADDVHRVAAK